MPSFKNLFPQVINRQKLNQKLDFKHIFELARKSNCEIRSQVVFKKLEHSDNFEHKKLLTTGEMGI